MGKFWGSGGGTGSRSYGGPNWKRLGLGSGAPSALPHAGPGLSFGAGPGSTPSSGPGYYMRGGVGDGRGGLPGSGPGYHFPSSRPKHRRAVGHGGYEVNTPRDPSDWGGYPDELYPILRGGCPHGVGPGCRECSVGGSAGLYTYLGEDDPNNPAIDANPYTGRAPVYQKGPSEVREFPIGFDSGTTDIAAAAASAVSTTIQHPFRGKRLIVDPAIASSFTLQSIVVGVTPQGAAVANMPMSAFVPESLVPLQLDTAQVGQQITINVTNRSAGGLRFLAAMVGDVLR